MAEIGLCQKMVKVLFTAGLTGTLHAVIEDGETQELLDFNALKYPVFQPVHRRVSTCPGGN